VTVDSAGTSRYHLGESPHDRTRDEAARRGIAIEHRARQFTAADFDDFDLVVAMDAANRRDVLRLAPDAAAAAKVVMLDIDGHGIEVPDPWGQPPAAYRHMFDLLEAACRGLVGRVAASSAQP
jgi:protein-tyrosine phosphatase